MFLTWLPLDFSILTPLPQCSPNPPPTPIEKLLKPPSYPSHTQENTLTTPAYTVYCLYCLPGRWLYQTHPSIINKDNNCAVVIAHQTAFFISYFYNSPTSLQTTLLHNPDSNIPNPLQQDTLRIPTLFIYSDSPVPIPSPLFSHSGFSSDQMIVKYSVTTDSPKFNNCSNVPRHHSEQILHPNYKTRLNQAMSSLPHTLSWPNPHLGQGHL